ncbi:MAG: AI-2E family transporter [Leptospiraceae bacterium]|nr:AI-2E family transporter [Leptospiraceae bacterium]
MHTRNIDLSGLFVQLVFLSLVLGFFLIIMNGLASLAMAFMIAILLSFLLNPLVNFVESIGLPRIAGVLLSLTVFIFSLYLFWILIWPWAQSEFSRFLEPDQMVVYQQRIADQLTTLRTSLQDFAPASVLSELEYKNASVRLQNLAESLLPHDFGIIGDLVTLIMITPILLVIMLLQGDQIYKRMMSMVPNRYFEMVLSLIDTIQSQIRKYLRGLGLQWLLFGFVFSMALWIGKVPYAFILGYIAASCNIIPYIGPVLGVIPSLVIGIILPEASISAALIALVVAQLFDNAFIQPVILAGSVQLHPIIAILTLITLQQYLGIIGMVIAIPFASIVMVSIQILYRQLKAYGII